MTTPIAFLFNNFPTDGDIWQAVHYRYPNQFSRKLSWRTKDKKLGEFLKFLEKNGKETDLANEVWQEIFFSHLTAITNQHFLFILWCANNVAIDTSPPRQWLPQEAADNFIRWHEGWQIDETMTRSFENSFQDTPSHPLPSYRGIELPAIFMYESIRTAMAELPLTAATKERP